MYVQINILVLTFNRGETGIVKVNKSSFEIHSINCAAVITTLKVVTVIPPNPIHVQLCRVYDMHRQKLPERQIINLTN